MSRVGAFLDRDGTFIRDTRFVASPDEVLLLDGAAAAIRALNEAGIPVIQVTNQSGIARGYFTLADYERVQARVEELLGKEGAHLDGAYMCPHHPDFTGPCDCRKPGTLLFERGAEDFGVALERSWYIGDNLRDIEPATALGGTGILVPSDVTPPEDIARAQAEFTVMRSLDEAVRQVIESTR